MLFLALLFLIITAVTGGLGFWLVVGTAALIARILFFIFLVCCVIFFAIHLRQSS